MKVLLCISMAICDHNLVVLRKDGDNHLIEVLSLPNFKQAKLPMLISYIVLVSFKPEVHLKSLFSLSQICFGATSKYSQKL